MLNKLKELPIEYKVGAAILLALFTLFTYMFVHTQPVPDDMSVINRILQLEKESGNELLKQPQLRKNVDTAQNAVIIAENALSGATNAYSQSVQKVIDNDGERAKLREQLYSRVLSGTTR